MPTGVYDRTTAKPRGRTKKAGKPDSGFDAPATVLKARDAYSALETLTRYYERTPAIDVPTDLLAVLNACLRDTVEDRMGRNDLGPE